MLYLYILISLFIAWIWVDYFRLIDIFNRDSLLKLILLFFGGAISVVIPIGLDQLPLPKSLTEINGHPLHDFLYCVFGIGFIEEIAKALPVLIALKFFRLDTQEPIDLVAFFCVSALGFAATENTLYFNADTADQVIGRGTLSTIGHMFNSAIVGYGLMRNRFLHNYTKPGLVWLYLLMASLSHGIFDFIIFTIPPLLNFAVLMLYFLLTISIFSTILNNALNNSAYFNYKKTIDPDFVTKRLLFYYLMVYVIEFFLNTADDPAIAIATFFYRLIIPGVILLITIVRLSRFKLIRNRWNPIRLELPFKFTTKLDNNGLTSSQIAIKGDSYNETLLNSYYQEYFLLIPVSSRSAYLEEERAAYIEEKLFLKNDETFYLTNVLVDIPNHISFSFLIKPKTTGNSFMYGKYPIVALLRYDSDFDMNDNSKDIKDFEFIEWAYIKPR